MNKDLLILIEPLIPKLYSFAMALFANEKMSFQAVLDAYTVYVLKEKRFLLKQMKQNLSSKERSSLRNFLKKELIKEIYDLSIKRLSHNNKELGRSTPSEFNSFYSLNTFKRAVLYLKLHEKIPVNKIQEIFGVQRFEIIESYYNGKEEILTHGQSNLLEEVSYQ